MATIRLRKQAGGLVFALGVQALFAVLLLWSFSQPVQQRLAREMTLLLPPALRTAPPSVIDARERPRALMPTPPLPEAAAGSTTPVLPPIDLHGMGQGLAGCAPEDHCTPGQTAVARPPRDADLLQTPDEHVEDRAGWQEQWAENHFTFGPCAGADDIRVGVPPNHSGAPVMDCLLAQYGAEEKRAIAARQAIIDAKAAQSKLRP